MPLHPPIRVAQKTATTGTGALQLLAPTAEFRTFKQGFGSAPVKVSFIISGPGLYETAVGTFNGEDQLSRDTVLNSSVNDALLNLPSGQKDVFVWWPGGGFDRFAGANDGVQLGDWLGIVTLQNSATFSLPALANMPYGFECTIRCAQDTAVVNAFGNETLDGLTAIRLRAGDTLVMFRGPTQWRIKSLAVASTRIVEIARNAGHIVGEVKALADNVPLPGGFLPCDGRNVNRTAYAQLFAVLGGTYGSGDGTTSFGIPDMRGRALAGADTIFGGAAAGRLFGVGPSWAGGETQRVLTVNEMPAHQHAGHTDNAGAHNHTGTTDTQGQHQHEGRTDGQGAHNHTIPLPAGAGVTTGGTNSYAGGATSAVATTTAPDHAHNILTSANGNHAHNVYTNAVGDHAHNILTDANGGGGPFNIVQPTMAFNVVIFAGV